MIAKPFLKWVGGKGQLLSTIRDRYPDGIGDTVNRYCEPFLGGGAVLFDLLSSYKFEKVLINDINPELINAYQQIKVNLSEVIVNLRLLERRYIDSNFDERKRFYYDMRDRFNNISIDVNKKYNIEKASLLIFLNRTCFNGLYRVNSKGEFNVPMGIYKNPKICDEENLLRVSKVLQDIEISYGDYSACKKFINKNTFVYIDPPYRPLTATSNFNSYSIDSFNDKEQIKLGKFFQELHLIGAKVVISNSDPKHIDDEDNFFDDIYLGYHIERVLAKRLINSKAEYRGKISELLISNY